MDGEVIKGLEKEDVITVKETLFTYDSLNIHKYGNSIILSKLKNV